MERYLTLFTGEPDAALDPETLFRRKKVHTKGWLIRIFDKKVSKPWCGIGANGDCISTQPF